MSEELPGVSRTAVWVAGAREFVAAAGPGAAAASPTGWAKMGTRFRSTMDDPVASLNALGWRASVSRVPALGESYDRPLPPGTDLAASNATMLVTAVRTVMGVPG